jgi:hypothetical protein
MSTGAHTDAAARYDAWNPGITSDVPKNLVGLSTIFRTDNVYTSVTTASELRDLTGFALKELVAFRAERLALHEVLIRVTADFVVPDGSRIEDLGINFRRIVTRVLVRCVTPQMPAIADRYAQAREQLRAVIEAAWTQVIGTAATPNAVPGTAPSRGMRGWLKPRQRVVSTRSAAREWGPADIADLERAAAATPDAVRALGFRALARVMSEIFKRHGCAWGTRELILCVATDMAGNELGSEVIGRFLEPSLCAAAVADAYGLLPGQVKPVVINTKGPSASGKSTLRPLQKKLASDVGVNWRDFALISPDIWRKQLLDYASLGAAYKYAGAFTGDEVQIIDQKLDRYMARKHQRGNMPHMLIDRFRFDSFATDSDEAGSNLLTRFGQKVYLFFVVTPPDLLVERAWKRGLEFGRYKAVDDTLAHSVEAYSGMPQLFFTWVRRTDKQLQFEFLDNTVSFGERPRTVAFGDNQTMNILDVRGVCNIERFASINVAAADPDSLWATGAAAKTCCHIDFLRGCIRQFRTVNIGDQATGRIYIRMEEGSVAWVDRARLQASVAGEELRLILRTGVPEAFGNDVPEVEGGLLLDANAQAPTLGQWGTWRPAEVRPAEVRPAEGPAK